MISLKILSFIYLFVCQGQYTLMNIFEHLPVLAMNLVFNCCPWARCKNYKTNLENIFKKKNEATLLKVQVIQFKQTISMKMYRYLPGNTRF